MPGKAGKASAMCGVRIVKTWILGFDTVEGTIEVGCFDSDFRDKIAVYVSGEGCRIALSWSGKEGLVNEV